MTALGLHRFQFAFTITYHYLFPQLTMGLALVLVVLKALAHYRRDPDYDVAARFWTRLLGVAFVMGVVTGIPMEFQFGTNWSRFSRIAGGVIGQTLAMEGVFAFFLESSVLYLVLFQEERLGPRRHFLATAALCTGTWLSGFFITCTNAFMQHPQGFVQDAEGVLHLTSFSALLLNPWARIEYAHTMVGASITGAFTVAAVGAFYLLQERHVPVARKMLGAAVVMGAVASLAAAFPTGDAQAKAVHEYQPESFAAMEGHFHTERGAAMTLVGQPNVEEQRIDNPIQIPRLLSFLTHQRWNTEIKGLTEFPRERWPDNIALLYYAYHIMAGLGSLFIGLMGAASMLLYLGKLFQLRPLLWALMLAFPLPFIANTAGWLTAELGRQPWLVRDVLRTSAGSSENVSSGSTLFSLLGFMGLYAMLSLLFFLIVNKLLQRGPVAKEGA
ncbi:MAG TPA: cytochrome ubiquinol oxidase subunit I [Polyangiaceae bacterium]|nr:cytochrome ubiquinol oxidase subunit I [Polyangiaceae bacterium]